MASDYKESCNSLLLILFLVLWVSPLYQELQSQTCSAKELKIANASMHASDNLIHLAYQRIPAGEDTENLQPTNTSREGVYWNTSLYAAPSPVYRSDTNLQRSFSFMMQLLPLTQMVIGLCSALIIDELGMMIIQFIITLFACQPATCLNKVVRTSCIHNPWCRILFRLILLGFCIQAIRQRPYQLWSCGFSLPTPEYFRKKEKNRPKNCEISGAFFVKSSEPTPKVKTHSTIGDGNCFWRALAHGLPCKWYSLKKRVLTHATWSNELSAQELEGLRKLKKRNAWANSEAIQYAVNYLECNVAVWHKGGFGIFPSRLQGSPTIFLTLHNQHFEALPTKSGLKLLATCDPHSPIPIEALAYCNDPIYEKGGTSPQRTIKISRPKAFENLATCLTFPKVTIHPHKIGMGIQNDVPDNPIPVGTRNPRRRDACNSQPRSGKSSRRIGQPARTSWPIWYLVTIFGLHCIGNYPKKYERPTLLNLDQYNLSSHTHHEASQLCENHQIVDSTTQALDPPHRQTKAVSDLWCKRCIGAIVAACDNSSAKHIKQSWVIFGDYNPQTPFTCPDAIPCHNSGKGKDFDIDGCNSTAGNYEGISPIMIQGLPKHPYGAHLTGGCIGAAHPPAGVHCKSPRNGSPKPPFGLSRSLVSDSL